MNNTIFTYSFEKLEVYQLARTLRIEIKRLTLTFPLDEKFELTSQIRRSSSSIATNLAEGSGRASGKDQAYFTNISYSSALETVDHLIYARDMSYISEAAYLILRKELEVIIKKISSLYKYQLKNLNTLKERIQEPNSSNP